jgi:uncharacterized protein (DUF433 family)
MKDVHMTTSPDELQKRLEASNPYWAGRHADYAGLVQPKLDVLKTLAQALGSEPAVYVQVSFARLDDDTQSIRAVALTQKLIITVIWSDVEAGGVQAEVRSRRDLTQISIHPEDAGGRSVFALRYVNPDSLVVLGGAQQTDASYEDLLALYPALNADLA